MDADRLFQVLVVVLAALALAWIVYLRRLARLLRERHADTAGELMVDKLFPRGLLQLVLGFDNRAATLAMVRFLWRRDYRSLRDPQVSRLGGFLRGLALAYLLIFGATFVGMAIHFHDGADEPPEATEAQATPQENVAHETHRRAYEHQRAGRLDEALYEYRRLMDLDPGKLDAYRGSNVILLRQKRYQDCVDLWSRYLRVFPGDAEGLYERSRAHFQLGNHAEALSDAKRACAGGKAEACSAASRMEARPGQGR